MAIGCMMNMWIATALDGYSRRGIIFAVWEGSSWPIGVDLDVARWGWMRERGGLDSIRRGSSSRGLSA